METRTFQIGERVWDCSHYQVCPRLSEILEVLPDGDRTVLRLKDEKGETTTSSENVLKQDEA